MALLAQRCAGAGCSSSAGILAARGKTARDCWIPRRMRQSGVVRCGNNTDEVDDGPLQEPQYYSYTDPNTGEPAPTFGARTPLPDMAFWGEDMVRIKRTAQASTPALSSSVSEQQQPSTPSAQRRQTFTSSRRKLKNVEARKAREEEINKLNQQGEELSEAEAEQSSASLERNGEDEDEDFDEEDEAQNPEMGLREIQQETGIGPSSQAPLSNDELWWNWKKPPVGQEPWSAWQKRMGDSDTVRHEFLRFLHHVPSFFAAFLYLYLFTKPSSDNFVGLGAMPCHIR